MMSEISIIKIREAYCRFKAYVYYDNFNLGLRAQLAAYENDEKLEKKLKRLAKELSDFLDTGKLSRRILKLIIESSFLVFPKSFKNDGASQKKNSILISNKQCEEYKVGNTTILYNGDIELHLIATLWIMIEGVKLNKLIGLDSYGYHLPMHPEKNILGTDKLLFTKYFEKYQEWRDNGIRAAKNQIEVGNDVLLISLDIKNFFHSTHIDFKLLKKDCITENSRSLTDIIEKICIDHTEKLKIPCSENRLPLLPIGLVSSGVIANWLLCDFDKSLKEKMAPVYYGRYVDDIFVVVSNVKPPHETSSCETNEEEIKRATIKWLAERFFTDNKPLDYKEDNGESILQFSEKKHKGLKIQGSKLRLFYFSPEWPLAMLNKFQKTIEENSSAFWFLPDEEEMKESLDDEAYDMQYEDTINKFRSVSDVKASKYGASVFLAKRIKLAILHNGSPDPKITKEVFRFFKGISILALYSMWEKVFSYLVVTHDVRSIKQLHRQILNALSELKSEERQDELVKTLTNHLNVCLQMSFSLKPHLFDLITNSDEAFSLKKIDIKRGIKNLRYSLLTRHHYLPIPSLIITDYYLNSNESLLSDGLLEKLLQPDSLFKKNEKLLEEIWRIPRWFYLEEACMFYFLYELKTWKPNPNSILFRNYSKDKNKIITTDTYIKSCCSLFEKLNNRKISKTISTENFKTYRDKMSMPKIDSEIVSIKNDFCELSFKLGLSNMRLDENDLNTAINDRAIISNEKRAKHIKHLNLAEQEKIDLLILPETSVPLDWLFAYADESRRKQRAFIFGLEHFTIYNYCFNFSVALLPFKIGTM
ncbi:MAG: RNA-directed DNA polymerase, partial [bacterium]